MSDNETTPPGWHPDPLGRYEYRYWEGTEWSGHVSTNWVTVWDPLEAAPVDETMEALGELADEDRSLFEELKAWRLSIARAAKIPAYCVSHDKTLTAIATLRPSTLTQLFSVPGVGPVTRDLYGETILEIIARHQ